MAPRPGSIAVPTDTDQHHKHQPPQRPAHYPAQTWPFEAAATAKTSLIVRSGLPMISACWSGRRYWAAAAVAFSEGSDGLVSVFVLALAQFTCLLGLALFLKPP